MTLFYHSDILFTYLHQKTTNYITADYVLSLFVCVMTTEKVLVRLQQNLAHRKLLTFGHMHQLWRDHGWRGGFL